jgi:hypothetical protein
MDLEDSAELESMPLGLFWGGFHFFDVRGGAMLQIAAAIVKRKMEKLSNSLAEGWLITAQKGIFIVRPLITIHK